DIRVIESFIREDPALANTPKGRPPLTLARSITAAELLLKSGADMDVVARWWAPGFYTRRVVAEVGRFLVERGAALTVHAAGGLGLIDRVSDFLARDPSLVHAKGGDGCTPLHFARNAEIAALLVNHGADVNARDEDHDSTPAQWSIGDAPEVSRFLIER